MSRVIVKNLPQQGINEEELRKHFSDIDNVTDIKLKYNDSGTFRRFAFVGFKSQDAAERAIEKLNSTYIASNKISVEACKAIRDVKPDKVMPAGKRKAPDQELTVNPGGQETNSKNKKAAVEEKFTKRKSRKQNDEEAAGYEEMKDDPEFKEFMLLQRNVGDNVKSKHIWSDDAKMDAENVAIPQAAKIAIGKPIKKSREPEKGSSPEGQPSLLQPEYATKKNVETKDAGRDEGAEDGKPRKRHHRSRPKKKGKSAGGKTEPKEIFVHTMKVKGIPEETRRKDVINFFKPLELLSIRLSKKDRMCYVSFKDESDLRFALRKDMQFWNTCRIKCVKHNVTRSKLFKREIDEKKRARQEIIKKQQATLAETEPLEESGRLFIRNLNYSCRQEDLEEVFSKYGELTEVHFPIDKQTSLPKGYAYVEFMFPQNAAKAYEELNGTIFQGRNFHLIPSKPKPESQFRPEQGRVGPNGGGPLPDGQAQNQSSFKREKLQQQKQAAPKGSNWNILFLGQNALADVVSDTRGVDKSNLLTRQSTKEPIAVRMALGDATAVDEMRKFLISNGIELDSFDNPQAPRSRTVIIVKNLPASSQTNKEEIQAMFEAHGRVARVIMPPNGLTAIVEMEEAVDAKLAFKRLAYSKFKDNILYLEWAPINVFREKSLADQEQNEMEQMAKLQTGTKILVKNVPFEATVGELKKIFAAFGELNFVRIPKKMDGQHRGFGFVDYLTKEDALRAFRGLCHSTHLYGRKLVLEWAKAEDVSGGGQSGDGASTGEKATAQGQNNQWQSRAQDRENNF